PKPNRLGVPQGSVLSPTLFNTVMAALPHALAEISDIGFTLYADDLTIWASHTCSLEKQEKVLQHALDVVESHLFRVGLRASPEKTTYVCVASKKYRDAQVAERLHLVLAGRRISPSPSVRVLGIAIREDAAADSWLEETIETCNKALNVIRRICSSGGGASDTVAKRLYKALVVSRVCYGARHFWLSKAHWTKLETLNNRARRVITGLPRFTPLSTLRATSGINDLRDVVETRMSAHEKRLQLTPSGRGILSLLDKTTIKLPRYPATLPPWEDLADITTIRPLHRKGDAEQLARRGRAHIKTVNSWDPAFFAAVYTDVACLECPQPRKTIAAFFPMSKAAYHDVIPPSSSTKQGELHAICLALAPAQEAMSSSTSALPANLRIFSDSQEAIKECKARASTSKLVRKIKNLASQLRGQGVHVKIEWVPGHAGIPGNEEAHRIARAALFLSGEETSPSHQSEHGYATQRDRASCPRTYNRQSTALNDHAELDADEHRSLIRHECRIRLEKLLPEDPDPLPSGLGRRARVLLLRIRMDTTVDPARIATWSQNKSSGLCQRCKLGARATFAHLAWSCPDLAAIRSRHRPLEIIQLESWTHPPGTEGARKRVLRTLLDFVFEAGLQAHI
ncbi:hypothetical protein ISCGN_005989, partial [Ixodes scapularis]